MKKFEHLFDYWAQVAVWKAALGDTTPLLKLLRGDDPIPKGAREQLALLLEGKLVAKKRSRGRPLDEVSPSLAIMSNLVTPVAHALRAYQAEAEALIEQKALRGNVEALEREIAERFGVTVEALQNAKKNPRRMKNLGTYEFDEAAPFRRWLADMKAIDKLLRKKST